MAHHSRYVVRNNREMTRSQATLIIGWFAFVPCMLLISSNAVAIPGSPGQIITNPEPATGFRKSDESRTAEAASEIPLTDSDPTATPELPGLASLHEDTDQQQPFHIRFGRRLALDSGILGETDGIKVDYRLNSGLTLRGIAGYPVASSKDEFNTTRQVLGFSAETGTIARAWNLSAYLFDEQDNAQLDNTTVGGTLRYRRPKRSLLLFMDYDANQDMLSAITASGAWKLPGSTTLSATFDIHNNATHKRQKKHLQHSMASIEGWDWILADDRIKHHTSKKTRKVITHGLGLSHAFSQRFSLSGNFAMLEISDNGLSDSTTSAAALPNEYFYNLKLTGKDLFIAGNSNKLDIRHRVTGSSRISTASIDTHYVINPLWKFSPRLKTELRDNITENSAEWITSPAVKMEYRWKKAFGFQIEAGGKWSNQANLAADAGRSTYFMKLGYQAKF